MVRKKVIGQTDAAFVLSFVRYLDFPYFAGAVYPSEMAFFLYECERAGIKCIIESGRGDGYSTAVIAAYGESKRIRIISIDRETDQRRAGDCRRRLSRYSRLELVVGDTFYKLPKLLRSTNGPVALLIDGPKGHEAIYLSAAAAAYGPIKVISHHNVHPGHTRLCSHFVKCFAGAPRLEDSELFRSEAFGEFRDWERRATENYRGPGRELDQTSLVVSVLPSTGPDPDYLHKASLSHRVNSTSLFLWWKAGCMGWPAIQRGGRLINALKAGPSLRRS